MNKKAVVIYPSLSSFIRNDIAILQKEFKIKQKGFQPKAKWQTPFLLLSQAVFLLRNLNADFFLIEFAGYHSCLPVFIGKIFKIPSLIVCGGNDCHSFPAISYGNHQKLFLGAATRFSLKNCAHISPKHQSLWLSEYTFDKRFPARQGIKAFIPEIKTPHTIIPNGYDLNFWVKNDSISRKPLSFITVSGNLHLKFQSELKGISMILDAAKIFKEYSFTIVGATEKHLLLELPENITVISHTDALQLRDLYTAHSFYLQLSLAEGFPNSLCEAMLCGCTPIVTSVFSMPEIVNGSGYIVKEKTDFELILRKISNNGNLMLEKPETTIASRFSLKNRSEKLLKLVNQLIQKARTLN